MKAIIVKQPGDSDVLELTDIQKPLIKEGWSLVKVRAFGINRSEIFTRKGYSPEVVFPRILGIECVGTIEESSDIKKLPVGQTVISIMGEMGRAFNGSYAEYVLLPNSQIYPVQTALSWEDLAAVPETYYTAYGAFKNLKINENDKILVRGATSGVGISFMKLIKAKFPNTEVFATTRNPSKAVKLLNSGFDRFILEKDGRLINSYKFTKILELVGPATIKDSIQYLSEGGIICSCGQLGEKWYLENFDPIMELKENIYLTTFYSGNVNENKLQEMLDFVFSNNIDVRPEKIFLLEDIQKAHDYLESDASFGKIVVINKEM